ncbi:MAG: 23S rRNA (pseudouridine(1915)-N(3))-methyltransferase RlmH [Sediminibacterium sp.]|nr:23S rRNA (pseudouridine(1915)-N(3))-methyltransferase RlmH [Sediminibacterium sp.]
MKFHIWTFGKPIKNELENEISNYTKRISHYYKLEWDYFKTMQLLDVNLIKKKEADFILKQIQIDDCLILLDESGEKNNSMNFAHKIQEQLNRSFKRIIFLIGGSYGVDYSVQQKANLIFSLSDLTFPHQLVRLILIEQIYRTCTIIANEKYHH